MQKKRLNLEEHPIRVLSTVVVATVLFCTSVAVYLHNSVVEQKNATIEFLNTELQSIKKKMVSSEKQPHQKKNSTNKVDLTDTNYSRLSNEQIKTRAYEIVQKLRNFSSEMKDSLNKKRDELEKTELSSKDRIKILNSVKHEHLMKFENRYKVESKILAKELRRRLSENAKLPTFYKYHYYYLEQKTREMADDIEEKAKLLPYQAK